MTVFSPVIRRENVLVHLRSTGVNGFPLVDIETDSAHQSRRAVDWPFSHVYHGLGHCINCCVRLRVKHTLPWSLDTRLPG